MNWLQQFVSVKPRELRALLVSCLYFFLVLCTYYIFRPIRNEMTIANGVENIQWLFMLGMLVMFAIMPVFGWITGRYRTRQFMAYCTLFFASNLLIFFVLFNVDERPLWVSRTFFVWVNVFNMFIVSLFWSFMNDVYSREQSKRLFAFIAAGGTAGAISGPIITRLLVETTGLSYLLLISALTLSCSVLCINWLLKWENQDFEAESSGESQPVHVHKVSDKAIKGSVFDGLLLVTKSPYLIGICLFILLYSISIVFVTVQQAEAIEANYTSPIERTALFANIDIAVSITALILQLFVTSRLIRWFGYRMTLALIPIGVTIGFTVVAAVPILPMMIGLEIFRRSGDYAIMKPTREMLFSVVSRKEKYRAKNFIDTAILRTGDAASSWLYIGAKALGAAGSTIPIIGVILGTLWSTTALWLGSQYLKKSKMSQAQDSTANKAKA